MRHTAYFLVEPNAEAAREFPLRAPADLGDILLEPLLTSRHFAGGSSLQEIELEVKLLHVGRLREFTPIASDEAAKHVLGSDRVSVEVFDRWWTIRRLLMDESSEDMEDYLVAVLSKVEATGNATVDMWVQGLAARKCA